MPPAQRPARYDSCTTAASSPTSSRDSIAPGHSGILALVSDPGAVEIRKALAAADAIVAAAIDDVAARDIKAAAKEAEAEDKS